MDATHATGLRYSPCYRLLTMLVQRVLTVSAAITQHAAALADSTKILTVVAARTEDTAALAER